MDINMFFQKIELVEKQKFWFPKALILNQVFHNQTERIESNSSLTSVKGHLSLTKGHLDNPEGQVEFESPLIRSYLW